MKEFFYIAVSVTTMLIAVLFIGWTTVDFKPFSIELARPYSALAAFLILSGVFVYIYCAIPFELLKK